MPLSDADKIINLEDLAAFKAKMDESVLHKTGTETVSGEKVFSGSQTTPSGNSSALLVVKDPNLVKGETPATNHYLSLGFIDSTGNSYAQDTVSRLGVVEYKSPSEADLEGYVQIVDAGFNGGGSAVLRVGHDKDNIKYATVPSTSEDRTGGTDIVTRDYLPKSKAIPQFLDLWNWQKTEQAGAVAFKPVPESDLEPVVDFAFTETPPAEGEKGPENPSTITGVTQAKTTRCGKNLIRAYATGSQIVNGVTFTVNADGSVIANGTASANAIFYYVSAIHGVQEKAGCQYVLSGCPVGGSNSTYYIRDATLSISDFGSGATVAASADGLASIRIVVMSGTTVSNLVFRPQIELGSTATAFEPYEGNDYTIQFGDTYYGGFLDVAAGAMTVTWGGGLILSFNNVTVNTNTVTCAASVTFRHKGNVGATAYSSNRFVSMAGTSDVEHVRQSGSTLSGASGVDFYIAKTRLDVSGATDPSFPTDAEWLAAANAWLTENPVFFVGELFSPYIVQLTPTQIRSLSALDKYESRINTVYTDQEAVQVGYQRYVGGAVKALGTTAARTLPERFADIVNVKDFGAKGDGVTDDTAAFSAAAKKAAGSFDVNISIPSSVMEPAVRGAVHVPSGTYNISSLVDTGNVDIIWLLDETAVISHPEYLQGSSCRSSRISRQIPFGILDYACAMSVRQGGAYANAADGSAGVTGVAAPSGLASYNDRDSVAFFVGMSQPPLVADVVSATYTATSIVPDTPLTHDQVLRLRVGMIIDTKHSPKCTGVVESWEEDGSVIYVKTGWYEFGTPGSTTTPVNGTGAYINIFTKIWAQNTSLAFENATTSPCCDKAIVHEYSVYNRRGDGSADINDKNDSILGVAVYAGGGTGYYKGQSAFYVQGPWRYGMYVNGGGATGVEAGYRYSCWLAPAGEITYDGFSSKTLGRHFVGLHPVSGNACFSVGTYGDLSVGEAATSAVDRTRRIVFNTASDGSRGSVELQAIGGAGYGLGRFHVVALDISCDGNVRPSTSGVRSLGTSDYLWTQVWASTGTIQTSDERLKVDVNDLPDDVLDAWGEVQWQQFRFVDAVQEKGDAARLHSGIVAQRIKAAFEARGLDARRYGLLCYDEWPDQYEEHEVEDAPAEFDEEGRIVKKPVTHVERTLVSSAGSRWSVRYEEALAVEAAYQRRRTDRLEARIVALEDKLA